MHESFRLIFVKVQLGLLQEALLAARVKPTLFEFLHPCQSGYCKAVDVPHLVLHELCSMARQQNRVIWLVMGDFKKAFPRVWRELLLDLLGSGPRLHNGIFELLASILASDSVHVWQSGISVVKVLQGIPEGGSIGPSCYNILPDSLVRLLEEANLGLGLGTPMPELWQEHSWSGHGHPDASIVANLRGRLRGAGHGTLSPHHIPGSVSASTAVPPCAGRAALQGWQCQVPAHMAHG